MDLYWLFIAGVILLGLMWTKEKSSRGKNNVKGGSKKENQDRVFQDGDHCWRDSCSAQHSVITRKINRLDTLGLALDGTAGYSEEAPVLESDKQRVAHCSSCGQEKIF